MVNNLIVHLFVVKLDYGVEVEVEVVTYFLRCKWLIIAYNDGSGDLGRVVK